MPYNLLLLPLMGGFLFFYGAYLLRFYAQRLDGYKLLFFVAVAGTCLATLARLVIVILIRTPAGGQLQSWWAMFSPFPYSGTSALAFLLGPLAGAGVNLFAGKEKAKDIEIRRHGNALMQLLHRAEREKLLIAITLESRKWYVGWVAESPNLRPDEKYFRLLPFISGYRDKDTLETYRTVFYEDALTRDGASAKEFVMILPLEGVQVANLFDPDVYDEYFAESESQESEPRNSATH
ncbi:MAG: hypothetical protein JO340_10520 [Acidobacteriaceae bacterium]|nr:hypothetical protein [Acidobacteriaceae bacterium]